MAKTRAKAFHAKTIRLLKKQVGRFWSGSSLELLKKIADGIEKDMTPFSKNPILAETFLYLEDEAFSMM